MSLREAAGYLTQLRKLYALRWSGRLVHGATIVD